MSDSGTPAPPISWLQHLHEAGQWERLEEIARQRLAAEPEDAAGHFHRAWALLRLERGAEMQPHVEHLLRKDAEDVRYLQLAALWHLTGKRYKKARTYLDTALGISPEDAALHHLGSIIHARLGKMELAKVHSSRARSFDPDDADYIHWDVDLRSFGKDSARDTWHALKQLEEALRLEPENPRVMAAIGDLWMSPLEQPRRAEEMYRQALACDPRDKEVQRKLWHAIQARNLLFRTLRIPVVALNQLRFAFLGLLREPWRFIFLFFACKFFMAYLLWLVAASVVFAPPAWLFEWLVLMDIRQADRVSRRVGVWWLRFHQCPFLMRFGFCLVLVLVFWWGLFAWLGIPPGMGLILVSLFFAVHLLCMLLYVFCRKLSAGRAADWSRPAA